MPNISDWMNKPTSAQSINANNELSGYVNSLDSSSDGLWTLPTGIAQLDAALGGGLTEARSTIVAGVPSSGKTAFCTQMAYVAARSGARVGYLSLELDEQRLLYRLLSVVTRIPYDRIAKRKFANDDEKNLLRERVGYAREYMKNIELLTMPETSPEDSERGAPGWRLDIPNMRKTIENLKEKHGLNVLILDYLQLAFNEDLRVAVPFCSFLLTAVPKRYKIHVLAAGLVSPKRISSRRDAEKVPEAGDVQWAGEAQADTVIFTHRPFLYTGLKVDMDKAQLIVTKNRDNPFVGRITSRFNGFMFYDPPKGEK